MSSGGFITLHREALNSWLWTIPSTHLKVALAILMGANWKQGRTYSGGQMVTIKRGQLMTSLDSLAKATNQSKKVVRAAISTLVIAEFITDEPNNKHRIITVCNYNKYQDKGLPQGNAEGHTEGTPEGTAEGTPKGTRYNKGTSKQGNKGTSGARKAHQMPDDWKPTANHAAKAAKEGFDLDELVEGFQNHHLARGNIFVSWDRAFSTWLTNAAKFAERDRAKQPSQPPTVYL